MVSYAITPTTTSTSQIYKENFVKQITKTKFQLCNKDWDVHLTKDVSGPPVGVVVGRVILK